MTLQELKLEVIKAGFTPSAADWENDRVAYAFSAESLKGTDGHPKFTATYNKVTGWADINGKTIKVK